MEGRMGWTAGAGGKGYQQRLKCESMERELERACFNTELNQQWKWTRQVGLEFLPLTMIPCGEIWGRRCGEDRGGGR